MNQNIIVAYFSKGGASEEYAQIITKTLKNKNFTVELCNLSEHIPNIESFNIVILGTGVRMSIVYRRWKKILKQKAIKKTQLFLFLSSGMAADEPEKAVEKFLLPIVKKYDLKPKSVISFPGKIPEKWAKYDDEKKMAIQPDIAKQWTEEIVNYIRT